MKEIQHISHYNTSFVPVNMVDEEYLIKEIKSLSDSIRKKNQALKLGIRERENFIENTFKPIVTPLKDLSIPLKNVSKNLEKITTNIENDEIMPLVPSEKDINDDIDEELSTEEEKEEMEERNDSDDTTSTVEDELAVKKNLSNLSVLGNDIATKGLLTRKYLLKFLHSTPTNRKYHVYGARLENDGIMIGDCNLSIDDSDNININGKSYNGTPGLFELIFKTSPAKIYTSRDLKIFKLILKSTNAHRKSYAQSSSIYRNTSKKYKNIISKLFPPQRTKATGSGMALKNSYETNVIYYNDINKLVDRMQLLHEAKQAGHTGIDNEIVALTDELRTRGYIE